MYNVVSLSRTRIRIVIAAAAALLAAGCSVPNEGRVLDDAGNAIPTSCASLINAPSSCGDSCTEDTDCALGTYCLDGECEAECTIREGCLSGQFCSIRGHCIDPTDGGGSSNPFDGGNACIDVEAQPKRIIPNVVFLVDRSGSMDRTLSGQSDPPPGQSRWEIAHDAIALVLGELQGIVRFGLSTYHWNGPANDPSCPILNTTQIGLNNTSEILSNYPATFPPGEGSNDTPTGDSIDALIAGLEANPPPADAPTIIVLATDGEPDTCEVPNPQRGQDEALTAATNARKKTAALPNGADTFILSVGADVSKTHLQQMANVGIGRAKNESSNPAPYWIGTTPEELENAFRDIISSTIVCEIPLNGSVADPSEACLGTVTLDSKTLACPSEWKLKDGTDDTIQLLGASCDAWKSSSSTLSATFPCGVFVTDIDD